MWSDEPCVVPPGGGSYGRHRREWVRVHGAVPAGLMVLHRCDVPGCYNVAHLWLGTQAENMRDASRKGRLFNPKPRKEQLPRPKRRVVTCEEAAELQRLRAQGVPVRELMARFGLSRKTVWRKASGQR